MNHRLRIRFHNLRTIIVLSLSFEWHIDREELEFLWHEAKRINVMGIDEDDVAVFLRVEVLFQ